MFTEIYCVLACIQNVIAVKTISVFGVIFDCGLLLSPIVFAFCDVYTELHGEKAARKVYVKAMFINIFVSLLLMLTSMLQGTDSTVNNAYSVIFGTNWRFILASAIAFFCGNFINARWMARSKGGYTVRAVLSSVAGQFIDNALFTFLAFAPIFGHVFELPIIECTKNVLCGTLLEIVFESITLPFTSAIVRKRGARATVEKRT